MAKKAAAKKSAAKAKKPAAKAAPKSPGKIAAKPAAKKAASKAAPQKVAAKSDAKKKSPSTSAVKPMVKSAVKSNTAKPTATVANASAKSSAGRSSVKFNPLDDRILVERIVGPEKTAGGLFIPDSAQEKPTTGKVVAVGRGHRDAKGRTRPCDVKVGDQVLFTAWSGSEIELEGAKYVILRETDLLGVTTL